MAFSGQWKKRTWEHLDAALLCSGWRLPGYLRTNFYPPKCDSRTKTAASVLKCQCIPLKCSGIMAGVLLWNNRNNRTAKRSYRAFIWCAREHGGHYCRPLRQHPALDWNIWSCQADSVDRRADEPPNDAESAKWHEANSKQCLIFMGMTTALVNRAEKHYFILRGWNKKWWGALLYWWDCAPDSVSWIFFWFECL